MSKPLHGTAMLTASAINAAANGGVEITQDNPTRQACGDVTAYQERSRIYRGMSFSRDEVAQAWAAFKAEVDKLDVAVTAVLQEFDAEREASCKAACEVVADSAEQLLARKEPHAIATLTGSMASTFSVHLSRRARV